MEFVISEQEYLKFDPETKILQVAIIDLNEETLDMYTFLLDNVTNLNLVSFKDKTELHIKKFRVITEGISSSRFSFHLLDIPTRKDLADFLFKLFKLTHYTPEHSLLLDS